jgi:hypothetical protein
MTLATDLAADGLLFDGAETVTLRQIRPAGRQDIVIPQALAGPLDRRDERSLGLVEITGDELVFHLPAAAIATGGVVIGDQILRADGSLWEVRSVSLATLKTRYRCVCR